MYVCTLSVVIYCYVRQVNVYPDLGFISWAGSNSGRAEEDEMVHEIVAALPFYSFIDCSSAPTPSDEGGGNDDSLTGRHIALIVIGVVIGVGILMVSIYVYLQTSGETNVNNEVRESLIES